MLTRRQTSAVFVLEGINSFATTLYFYYVYFFTKKQFGFSEFQNLTLAASLGFTYALSSVVAGRFGQSRGYFTALKVGYAIMTVAIGAAAFVQPLAAHLVMVFVGMFGMALTWPALEALVSEGETGQRLQRNVGIYNLVWGGTGALAYFCGGSIIKAGGFATSFLITAGLSALQLISILVLERTPSRGGGRPAATDEKANADETEEEAIRSPVNSQTFLRMAWLANPFGYLAINTVIAVMPALALKLQLTVAQAGFFCSIWLFVRTGSFLLLWLWPGWHYRFRWLAGAFAAMTVSFVALLLASNLALVIIAQVIFGLALGLTYYSSLYYSMHVGETKGEHGGFHEAMIGAGSCAGPAIGAVALHFVPGNPASSTWAVMVLLSGGFAGLLWLRFKAR